MPCVRGQQVTGVGPVWITVEEGYTVRRLIGKVLSRDLTSYAEGCNCPTDRTVRSEVFTAVTMKNVVF
jgi:hypothetical protein